MTDPAALAGRTNKEIEMLRAMTISAINSPPRIRALALVGSPSGASFEHLRSLFLTVTNRTAPAGVTHRHKGAVHLFRKVGEQVMWRRGACCECEQSYYQT